MGEVTISSGTGSGSYNVLVDTGTAQRDERIAEIDARIVEIAAAISDSASDRSAAQSYRNETVGLMNAAIDAFVAAPVGNNEAERTAVSLATKKALRASADLEIAEIGLDELEFELSAKELEKTALNGLDLENDKDVWCCDLTTSATGTVASIEIPGENKSILIAPGAPAPSSADGHLEHRGVQQGHQCYFNAAILPGWQKFMPTYRLGEITSFNGDSTCTVNLDGVLSSANNLDINIRTTLLNVPFDYMDCGRAAFDDGDRVVIRFKGQDWDDPEVIGFESNPKGCNSFIFTPSDESGPVLIYPAGEGVKPSIIQGGDLPFAVAYERYGSVSKFSHDTKPYHISSQSKVPYIKGSPVLAGNNNKAVFAVVGGRYIIVDSTGFVYSVGLEGTTSAPYDATTNPSGYAHIGTLPYSSFMYIRPDGGKMYGFDDVGYCSATISDDGFSVSIINSTEHEISDGGTSTLTEEGVGPGEPGANGLQTQNFASSKSYTGVIGVFWTGSPGFWIEQIVTATSAFSSQTLVTCSWVQAGGFYDGTTTVAGSSTQTLHINAGGAYSKQITHQATTKNWDNTFTGALGWGDNPFPLGDILNTTDTETHQSTMPRILGGKGYVEETNNTSYTTTRTSSGTYPHNFVYSASVTFGGNTATHNGVTIKKGEELSAAYGGSWTSQETADSPSPVSGIKYFHAFLSESGYRAKVAGGSSIFDIVLRNSRDDRIAETATKFMIAEIVTGVEVTLLGSSEGANSTTGPYLSTYGFLNSLLGLGESPTGGEATIY